MPLRIGTLNVDWQERVSSGTFLACRGADLMLVTETHLRGDELALLYFASYVVVDSAFWGCDAYWGWGADSGSGSFAF